MYRIFIWIFFLAVGLSFLGCQKAGEEETPTVEADTIEASYTPPSDGKISQEQVDSYIQAAILLQETVLEQEKAIHEYVKVHNLSDDLHELQDTLYVKNNLKVKEEYEKLFTDSQRKLDEVYDKVGLGEDEFTWIGGALADTINEPIRKQVEEALRPPEIEEGT